MTHGRILCGTATVPDLEAALADYSETLGLMVIEKGTVPFSLAASWGCPDNRGSAYAILQPASGADSYLRLVEQPLPPAFRPTRTFGWAAFELTVQNVYGWPALLEGSGFDIIGPPKEIPGLPYFVAMQMTGRGREMIYLNEVRSSTPSSDLPPAKSPIDHAFIVILACADRLAALGWYRDKIGLDIGGDYTIAYTMIQKAFDLPAEELSTITMVQKGRMPIIEVDGYPEAATVRASDPGHLPPGNAIVTLEVDSLDALDLDWISPPAPHFLNRRAAAVRGPAGELLELVEAL
jgi:catechol 2,3-dioxygenase-like lactoylglutathione lyase family enzyme